MSVDFEQRKKWYETLFNKNQDWYDEQTIKHVLVDRNRYILPTEIKKSIDESPWNGT